LNVLHNYFDSFIKLYLTKFLNISAKSFRATLSFYNKFYQKYI